MNENGKKTIFGGGAFLSAVIVTLAFSYILSLISYATGRGTTAYYIWSNIVSFAVFLSYFGIVLLSGRLLGVKPDYDFKKTSVISYAAGALTAVVGIAGFYMITMLYSMGLEAAGYIPGSSTPGSAAEWILAAVRVILFAPVCEEILMRSGVITGTNALTAGKKGGYLLSVIMCGFLFMLLHMSPGQTVYQFLLGCLLALLTISSGSVIPAIIAHALNNAIALIMEITVGGITIGGRLQSSLYSFFEAIPALFVIVAVLTAAGALAIMYYLCKALKKINGRRGFIPEAAVNTKVVDADNTRLRMYGIFLYVAAAAICIAVWLMALL